MLTLDSAKALKTGDLPNLQLLERRFGELQGQINSLEEEMSVLFGVEHNRKNMLERELRQLNLQRDSLQKIIAFWQSGYYQWIPLNPLSWRDEITKLPTLALFDLEHPEVGFYIQWYENIYSKEPLEQRVRSNSPQQSPLLPNPLRGLYEDVKEVVAKTVPRPPADAISYAKAGSGGIFVGLVAIFSGTIPSETRKKIRSAVEASVFEHIWLLAEVNEWTVKLIAPPKPVPIKVDPIVVGWTELYPDRLWYIDDFDVQPLENQIPISI